MLDRKQRFYRAQIDAWALGQSRHDVESDHCCPDFSCCCPMMFEKNDVMRIIIVNKYHFDLGLVN